MILSNLNIHKAIDDGLLVIEPQPQPRMPNAHGECPYQTSAVDLTLGGEISWLKEGMPISIDFRQGKFKTLFTAENCVTKAIAENDCYVLQPGHFVLGKTRERVGLPIQEGKTCLAARVEGRSSYARCGLLVHFTAPTIHSGFDGTITLEMMNFGRYPICLYPNTPICQLIVEQVEGTPFRNDSQFQGQRHARGN